MLWAQSRQSAKPFLRSSELGLPQPLTRRRVCPPPGSGGRGTIAGERGLGRVPIPTRGHTLWYSLFIRIFVVVSVHSPRKHYVCPVHMLENLQNTVPIINMLLFLIQTSVVSLLYILFFRNVVACSSFVTTLMNRWSLPSPCHYDYGSAISLFQKDFHLEFNK